MERKGAFCFNVSMLIKQLLCLQSIELMHKSFLPLSENLTSAKCSSKHLLKPTGQAPGNCAKVVLTALGI